MVQIGRASGARRRPVEVLCASVQGPSVMAWAGYLTARNESTVYDQCLPRHHPARN